MEPIRKWTMCDGCGETRACRVYKMIGAEMLLYYCIGCLIKSQNKAA